MNEPRQLTELKKMAQSLRAASEEIAKSAGCELVDSQLLKRMLQLHAAARRASETAMMTRDYSDCHQREGGKYNGKRWLIRRDEFNAVMDVLRSMPEIVDTE